MHILLIDDDPEFSLSQEVLLKRLGHSVRYLPSGKKALRLKKEELSQFDVAIIDMQMPEVDGLATGKKLKKQWRNIVTIMLTGHPDIEGVIKAFRDSDFDDYLVKSETLNRSKINDVLLRAQRLLKERKALSNEYQLNEAIRTQSLTVSQELVGQSPAFKEVLRFVERVAPLDCTVLIRGETGTGKGIIARAIHDSSNRCHEPFIHINCGSIPSELMESELFGHVKGAFTGALDNKTGLFTLADGGTVLLDEIGDLPLKLQVKLLDVLQEKRIRPVGGRQRIEVDVRILAATNQNLEQKIKEKVFREDLFYRLNVVPLWIPPLKERLEDIESFVGHFIRRKSKLNPRVKRISPQALDYLKTLRWKGNIRELRNKIERAIIWSQQEYLSIEDVKDPSDVIISPQVDHSPSLSIEDVQQGLSVSSAPSHISLTDQERRSASGVEKNSYHLTDTQTLWNSFIQNGYKLWTIKNHEEVAQELRSLLMGAKYIKKGHFGRLQLANPAQLTIHLDYVNVQSYTIEQARITFDFGDDYSERSHADIQQEKGLLAITQPVLKGLPDTYIFGLLYPSSKKTQMVSIPSPSMIKAIILRYAQAHAAALSLKNVFRHVMSFLIEEDMMMNINGTTKDGLEATRAYLCRKGYLFSGMSKKLKSDPDAIERDIKQVFPDYRRPPLL